MQMSGTEVLEKLTGNAFCREDKVVNPKHRKLISSSEKEDER